MSFEKFVSRGIFKSLGGGFINAVEKDEVNTRCKWGSLKRSAFLLHHRSFYSFIERVVEKVAIEQSCKWSTDGCHAFAVHQKVQRLLSHISIQS